MEGIFEGAKSAAGHIVQDYLGVHSFDFFSRELLGISFNEGWKCPFSKKIIETLLDLTSGSLETARVPLSKNNIALGLKIISSNNSQSLKQNQRVRNNLPPPPS